MTRLSIKSKPSSGGDIKVQNSTSSRGKEEKRKKKRDKISV